MSEQKEINDLVKPNMDCILILSSAKGAALVVFSTSEIAASVALAATGKCSSSLIKRTTARYVPKDCAMLFSISILL